MYVYFVGNLIIPGTTTMLETYIQNHVSRLFGLCTQPFTEQILISKFLQINLIEDVQRAFDGTGV